MANIVCRDCIRGFARGLDANAPCPACGSRRLVRHPELDALSIAHVDCDAFYAAIEKRDQPSLRDRPVIVGHPGGRGVVTTACYVARRFGPRSAMPMFKALSLCPQAVVIAPNMAKYREAGRAIRSILATATPVLEPVSLDEAYLDLSPTFVSIPVARPSFSPRLPGGLKPKSASPFPLASPPTGSSPRSLRISTNPAGSRPSAAPRPARS